MHLLARLPVGLLGVSLAALASGCEPPATSSSSTPATLGQAMVERRAAPRPAPAPTDSEPVAQWKGGTVSADELEAHVGTELRNREIRYLLERYEVQAEALDQLVMERLLEAEVERQGLADVNDLLRKEVDDRVPEPTEEEIQAFWPVVERQFRGATLEEARPVVVAQLVRRARERRYADFVEELRQRSELDIRLPYPNLPRAPVPVEGHDPSVGPADAPVTIVQFAEYQCFYCNRVKPSLERLMEAYPDKVRVVWKDYPLSNHGRAVPAAIAAHCAGEQGKYWEMSGVLLANQHALSDADIAGHARDLGLSPEPFQTCMSSGRYEPTIQEDQRLGRSLGIDATPTFFVNGTLLSGAQPYERFQSLVERELSDEG